MRATVVRGAKEGGATRPLANFQSGGEAEERGASGVCRGVGGRRIAFARTRATFDSDSNSRKLTSALPVKFNLIQIARLWQRMC